MAVSSAGILTFRPWSKHTRSETYPSAPSASQTSRPYRTRAPLLRRLGWLRQEPNGMLAVVASARDKLIKNGASLALGTLPIASSDGVG